MSKEILVSLFVRLWVEILIVFFVPSGKVSASSWGCELKCAKFLYGFNGVVRQPLREAVSWNELPIVWQDIDYRQPLREAVSWNIDLPPQVNGLSRQPLREAVSWNTFLVLTYPYLKVVSLFVRLWVEMVPHVRDTWKKKCQPLREAVSWNNSWEQWIRNCYTSASSWGCELKYMILRTSKKVSSQPLREAVSWNATVSALIACWMPSASSWGCELKYEHDVRDACLAVVSLFVRLWVEMHTVSWSGTCSWSASSWGCELKWLREETDCWSFLVSLFVRLWVEIRFAQDRRTCSFRQPLREAVSWNAADVGCLGVDRRQSLREAVSWNTNNLTAINSE